MKQPRIFCIGCSFTAGVPDTNFASWTYPFSKLVPEYEVYNLAVSGSSTAFHSWLARSIPKMPGDIVINQITNQGRITFWNEFNVMDSCVQKNGVNILKQDILDSIKVVNAATPYDQFNIMQKFSKQYFKHITDIGMITEFENNVSAITNYTDYNFFFLDKQWKSDNTQWEYDSFIESTAPEDDWFGDEFYHLSEKGCDKLAKWVYNNIKSRGII